jgi:hypothetical protein
MKNRLLLPILLLLCYAMPAGAQRKCGFELTKAALIAKDPTWAERYEAQRASLQGIADNYKTAIRSGTAQRTTAAASPIPVIFHIIVDTDQFNQIGGYYGIQQRIDSQIVVLNRDYNRQNADSTLIPYGWKHLYAATGIQFGLAHTAPNGWGSYGYEVRFISSSLGGFEGASNDYSDAKHAATGGLDAWDVTKYLNVWCINFTDYDGLLGLTVFKSGCGGTGFPIDEEGICVNYQAFGKRTLSTDNYIACGYSTGGVPDYYDLGRTLTHEVGHFFEIWHTWGDDGGACPWTGAHEDDGLADTPPEANYKYYNYPDTIPGGTYYDACHYDGVIDTQATLYGIASLDYMNYTDDIAMHMFTTDQAAVMAAQVAPGGENYSLTQNPTLLNWPANTGVNDQSPDRSISIYPNPASTYINIGLNTQTNGLQHITICNILGQEIYSLNTANAAPNFYSIDLSAMSKGIYFVRCTFASGTITRKILLQ